MSFQRSQLRKHSSSTSRFNVGSRVFEITYQGGTGNDVVLTTIAAISINDVQLTEGDSGATSFIFTVSISAAPAADVTVTLNTADGTATAGGASAEGRNDYVPRTNQTLTFTPGGLLTRSFAVTVNGDTVKEPNEVFTVNLSNVTGPAIIADGQGLGTTASGVAIQPVRPS